jgi:hypothetical protein
MMDTTAATILVLLAWQLVRNNKPLQLPWVFNRLEVLFYVA